MSANANLPNLPIPPHAGFALKDHDALPAGTRFGEFEVIRVLGVGGFGIVYLAQDHSLERQVALKEYMPASLAARGAGPMITVRAGAFAETYAAGLRSFINEARLLARFDHPSLVKVYRFWEDNGTAYMVMPYLQGRTLRDARRSMGHPPDEAWIRGVLDPLLDALEKLHAEGVFHRDIAPDNILLPPGAPPILLDFGAARRVINDHTQSLTAIVKPSYAPIEQYAEMAAMRQGPWTDLYALGAVLHYLLFGVPPAPATARAVQPELDQNEPIDRRAVPGVSPRFLGIVAWMLGVRPMQRPQSVAVLRAALNGQVPVPAGTDPAVTVPLAVAPPVASAWAATAVERRQAPANPAPKPAAAAATHFVTTVPGSAPLRSTPPGTLPPAYVPPVRSAVAAPAPLPEVGPAEPIVPTRVDPPRIDPPRRPRLAWGVAGGLAAAAIAAGVLWQFVGVITAPRPPLLPLAAAGVAVRPETRAPVGSTLVPSVNALPTTSAQATPIVPAPSPAAPPEADTKIAQGVEPAASAAAPSRPRARVVAAARTAPVALHARAESLPATARQACGDRNFISRAVCMDRECERPRFRASPECVKVLEMKRRRFAEH